MTLKTLVTGVAAAAAVVGAAAGVTSIACPAVSSAPAVQPVVWDIPLPQAPAPELQAPLLGTLQALAGAGSFSGKSSYIQGGIGRIESIAADRAYNKAAAAGCPTRPVARPERTTRQGMQWKSHPPPHQLPQRPLPRR